MNSESIDVSEDDFDAAVLKDERPVLEGVPSRSQLSEFLAASL
ncbi:hypothetical protein KYC5002_50380 [Archangium violaceum]|nr:hypothetical protein KYC5002_50380 [Archangium gephyra]